MINNTPVVGLAEGQATMSAEYYGSSPLPHATPVMKPQTLSAILMLGISVWLAYLPIGQAQEEPVPESIETTETTGVEETPEAETTEIEPPRLEDFETLAQQCRTSTGQTGLAACDRALELNDRDTALWINRGIKLDRDLSDPNAALNSYYQAAQLDLNQDFSLAWFNQCAILLKMARKPSLAEPAQLIPLLSGLELIPTDESTSAADLTVPESSILYKAVIATCDRAIQGDQDWGNASIARAWNNLGYAQDELGNYGAALEAYEAALAENPEHLGVLNNKAIALENLQRYAEALAVYNQALEIDPNYVLASRNRARVLRDHPELRSPELIAPPEESLPEVTPTEEAVEQVIPNQ